jgi:hypothetical protein
MSLLLDRIILIGIAVSRKERYYSFYFWQKNVYQKYIPPLHHHFYVANHYRLRKKMNRQVYKKQTTRDTTSEMTLPKIELQLDSLQFRNRVYVDEEGNHVYGRISIEGNNGIGILKANGCTIEVVL